MLYPTELRGPVSTPARWPRTDIYMRIRGAILEQARMGRRGRRDCLVQTSSRRIHLDSNLVVEQNRNSHLGSLLAAACLPFALLSAPALACELSEPHKGTVAEVNDGETLQLTDGTVVPRQRQGADGTHRRGWRRPWPMVNEAKEALSKLASGAEVELR